MQSPEHSLRKSIFDPDGSGIPPFIKLERAYLKPGLSLLHWSHKITFFMYFDDQTTGRFLGRKPAERIRKWAYQYLCFEFSSDTSICNESPMPVLGVRGGEVFEYPFDGNGRLSDGRPMALDALSCQLLSRLFRELCCTSEAGHPGYISGIVHLLVAHLFHYRLRDRFREGGLTPWKVARVTAFMQEHLSELFTLTELADHLKISPGYLCTRFRQSTGFTPFAYLNKLRMEKAMELLQNTDMLVIQVALEVGIDNHAQFCRAFKKFYGLAPSRVRKQERN